MYAKHSHDGTFSQIRPLEKGSDGAWHCTRDFRLGRASGDGTPPWSCFESAEGGRMGRPSGCRRHPWRGHRAMDGRYGRRKVEKLQGEVKRRIDHSAVVTEAPGWVALFGMPRPCAAQGRGIASAEKARHKRQRVPRSRFGLVWFPGDQRDRCPSNPLHILLREHVLSSVIRLWGS